MTATTTPTTTEMSGWVTAAMGASMGSLLMGAYAFGYLAQWRRVETAAEARERRQKDLVKKRLRRLWKNQRRLLLGVAAYDGESLDLPILSGVLHLCEARREQIKESSTRLNDWIKFWADEVESYVPRQKGVKTAVRFRRGKYPGTGPVRYGSSKRGKCKRAWANMPTPEQIMPGVFLQTATGKDLERIAKLTGLNPEVVGAVDTTTVHELFKSEIEPIVRKKGD